MEIQKEMEKQKVGARGRNDLALLDGALKSGSVHKLLDVFLGAPNRKCLKNEWRN